MSRERVVALLWEFAFIAAPAVVINPIAGLVRNWWVLTWRLCLMQAYIEGWDTSAPPIEGAAQRVHEDTQRFASGLQSGVIVWLEALLTLAVFEYQAKILDIDYLAPFLPVRVQASTSHAHTRRRGLRANTSTRLCHRRRHHVC